MAGILTLSGWGQPHDALEAVAPGATHVNYAKHGSAEAALSAIADTGRGYDTVIGWSLGGQLAVRAVAAGMLAPKKLVLIAAPFQFVGGEAGMGRDTYKKFRDNYAKNPARTLDKAWALIHQGDTRVGYIEKQLEAQDKNAVLRHDWLRWLEAMEDFSFSDIPLAGMPKTLLIHGGADVVVAPQQSRYFAKMLPQAELMMLPGAGHAPHWHDTEAVAAAIKEFARV
ncbi:MAG: alpha/beta fold hydrolase [Pseudomonadota bacterium]|nr:alpha/beta fold hydrolase [Pseudomonadota bacterium]MDE3038477.1 alpha/beta fold hydrolase [Pseudomonadota bacterium]